jgi:hypothetical protein
LQSTTSGTRERCLGFAIPPDGKGFAAAFICTEIWAAQGLRLVWFTVTRTCSHPPALVSGCNWLLSSVRSARLSSCDSESPHVQWCYQNAVTGKLRVERPRRWTQRISPEGNKCEEVEK